MVYIEWLIVCYSWEITGYLSTSRCQLWRYDWLDRWTPAIPFRKVASFVSRRGVLLGFYENDVNRWRNDYELEMLHRHLSLAAAFRRLRNDQGVAGTLPNTSQLEEQSRMGAPTNFVYICFLVLPVSYERWCSKCSLLWIERIDGPPVFYEFLWLSFFSGVMMMVVVLMSWIRCVFLQ